MSWCPRSLCSNLKAVEWRTGWGLSSPILPPTPGPTLPFRFLSGDFFKILRNRILIILVLESLPCALASCVIYIAAFSSMHLQYAHCHYQNFIGNKNGLQILNDPTSGHSWQVIEPGFKMMSLHSKAHALNQQREKGGLSPIYQGCPGVRQRKHRKMWKSDLHRELNQARSNGIGIYISKGDFCIKGKEFMSRKITHWVPVENRKLGRSLLEGSWAWIEKWEANENMRGCYGLGVSPRGSCIGSSVPTVSGLRWWKL